MTRALHPRTVHPIEVASLEVLHARIDLSHLPPLSRAVAERMIHASADVGYADDLVLDENALERGWHALAAGAPIVADARMVAAGITARDVDVPLSRFDGPAPPGDTRSAAAFRRTAGEVGPGAVWVVGNAPTALAALLEADARPALVVGLPVGFIGAVEAKDALRASGLPAVTNRSERGGSAVAAAAINALLYSSSPPIGAAADTRQRPDPPSRGDPDSTERP